MSLLIVWATTKFAWPNCQISQLKKNFYHPAGNFVHAWRRQLVFQVEIMTFDSISVKLFACIFKRSDFYDFCPRTTVLQN